MDKKYIALAGLTVLALIFGVTAVTRPPVEKVEVVKEPVVGAVTGPTFPFPELELNGVDLVTEGKSFVMTTGATSTVCSIPVTASTSIFHLSMKLGAVTTLGSQAGEREMVIAVKDPMATNGTGTVLARKVFTGAAGSMLVATNTVANLFNGIFTDGVVSSTTINFFVEKANSATGTCNFLGIRG